MNAASLRAFDAQAAAAAEALWPATVLIGGVECNASVTPPRETGAYDGAGSYDEGELVVRILKSNLPTAPARDTTLTWNAKKWKIRRVSSSEAEAKWTLHCDPKN